ncbi:MAG: S46 family peptidase [Candidatus Koribacter versatilis]|uniref:Dipeptidyl-peptidase n=1 Tax=Candidatus Korobacter versatilis TaxID=658062 RepID=A0A932A6W5_9BACT|nr:S46 family peptidase [Candidatus Koribacter versatilis]
MTSLFNRLAALLCLVALFALSAPADEGMWLFNVPPKDKIQKKYGFTLTQPWLDHLRMGSVRFNNGGSGSFVSPDGLAFTNHHVGADCLSKASTEGKDYIKTGFYAKTQAEEVKCPDLELNQLLDITDVTAKVNAGAKPGMSTADLAKAQRAAMAAIESECADPKQNIRCDVVTFYSGGMFHLYKYKKFTDVRIAFAPEFGIAFFGGDPDNFEYPRYDLDITFFRVYENDKPVHLDHYLKWSTAGVKDGELVFVSGHPGSTGRLNTTAQLEFLRDVSYPWRLDLYQRLIPKLKAFAAKADENRRIAQEDIFGFENSQKAIKGYQSGLTDPTAMSRKTDAEKKMRASIDADPKEKAEFGGAWDDIAKAMQVQRDIFFQLQYIERGSGFRSELSGKARDLVRLAAEKQKPNAERLREYRESALPSLEQELLSTAPIYKALDVVTMSDALADMAQRLGPNDPTVKRALNGKSPDEAAAFYINGSHLDDPAVRKQLYEGGAAAIARSDDPLIALWRDIDPAARAARKRYDDEVDAVVRRNGALISKARFTSGGAGLYPDATFTLRLSYGAVKGFVEDGRGDVAKKGERVPYFTTIAGAYKHAAAHGNKDPYMLPDSWMKAKAEKKIKEATPLNFISTPDIIGGNSGSPVVNRAGEVVGIIFDGNIQSLPWNFQYEDQIGRSVSVDSRGIIEALRNVYGAEALANELLKAPPKPYAAAPGHAADTNKPAKEVKSKPKK